MSHMITICHHSASLVMPIGDPQEKFFYLILTTLIAFYNLRLQLVAQKFKCNRHLCCSHAAKSKIQLINIMLQIFLCENSSMLSNICCITMLFNGDI